MKDYYTSFEYDFNNSIYGKEIQEKYDVVEPIYQSDNSVLYKMTDDNNAVYVLKAIKLNEHLKFDVETVMSLKHKGIGKIIEHGYSENYLYLVREYIEGMDLERYINENGKLSADSAIGLIRSIADILVYLHNNELSSIIYRDLKPSNIILTPDGDVRLIDVITIRTVKEQNTDTFYIGSRGFSAPEQYGFSQSTQVSDIYSLGATLFYLVTGKVPENTENIKGQLTNEFAMTDTLYHVISKAMQFNPSKRYNSVQAMIKDLQRDFKKVKRLRVVSGLLVVIMFLLAGWIYTESQFQLSDIKSPQDISMLDMTTIEAGMSFELDKDNVMHITFDRTEMADNIANFTYITVGTSIETYDVATVQRDIYYGLTEGFGFTEYFREGVYVSLENRNNIAIALYDNDKKPIAYYIENGISLFVPDNITTYESIDSVDLSQLQNIETGLTFTKGSDNIMNITADKTIMDKNQKAFEYMSVWTSQEAYQIENIKTEVYNSVMNNSGMFPYSAHGYDANTTYGTNMLVLIFSETKEPMGYYIYNVMPTETVSVETEVADYNTYDVDAGIRIEYYADYATVFVDENVEEKFTKISLWGSGEGLAQSTVDWIRDAVDNNNGVYDYDWAEGFSTGYGDIGSFTGQGWMLFLLDDSNNVLREYKIEKE